MAPSRRHERAASGRSAFGRWDASRRKIRPGDLIVLFVGGGLVLGLVMLYVSAHGKLTEAREMERLAWEEAETLEAEFARLAGGATDRREGMRWASILEAPEAVPFEVSKVIEGWAWGLYDPAAGRLLLILGGMPADGDALHLTIVADGRSVTAGAVKMESDGRAVLCFDEVPSGASVKVARSDASGASAVLEGRTPAAPPAPLKAPR